jgi:hypothetical protein
MPVVSYTSLHFQREIMYGIVLEVMVVPKIVSTSVKIKTINCNDFGMVPRYSFSPGPNPKLKIGVVGDALCKFLDHLGTVDGHTNNVTKHHSNPDSLVQFFGHNFLESLVEFGHEYSIWRPETHDIGKYFGSGQDLGHLFRKPIVMTFWWIVFVHPTIFGGLVELSYNLSRRYIPTRVMVMVVVFSQHLICGVAHMAEANGIVVFNLISRGESIIASAT